MTDKKANANKKPEDQKAEAPKVPKNTIGALARKTILDGKSNQETLAVVKAAFPAANTTLNSINWYRNDLRKKGHKVPKVDRPAAQAKKKDAAADKGDDLTA